MKAALYVRVSSDMQVDNFSIPAQLRELREYCLKNNIKNYKEYIDEGYSGTKENRPMFQQMIQESKEFDLVLVHKYDRFARKVELSQRIKKVLKENNVNVISITEPVDDSPVGFIHAGLMELLNEYYVRNLSKEVIKGMTERAKQGKHTGKVTHGYRVKNDMLVINKEEEKIVKLIFEKYLEGYGITKIYILLKDNNIKTRNGYNFSYSQIRRILYNPVYTGKIVFSGKIYEGNHEYIIDELTFKKVQDRLTQKGGYLRNRERRSIFYYKYYLIGLLYCGECKKPFRILNKKTSPYSSYIYTAYSCSAAQRYLDLCNNKKCFRPEHLESDIEEIFINFMKNKINFKPKINKNVSKYDVLMIRQNKIPEELKRAKQAYLSGAFELNEYKEEKERLDQELKELKEELKNIKNEKFDIKIHQRQIKSIWDEFIKENDICRKREILKNEIDKIFIYKNGKCEILFQNKY